MVDEGSGGGRGERRYDEESEWREEGRCGGGKAQGGVESKMGGVVVEGAGSTRRYVEEVVQGRIKRVCVRMSTRKTRVLGRRGRVWVMLRLLKTGRNR